MITILSSYIRFKNYREILEELREKQTIMIDYIDKYKKQKNNLEYLYQIKEDNIKFEEIEKIKNDVAEYDTLIKSTSILEYLTTKDIIKFNSYKGDFDLKIKETILKFKKDSKAIEEKYKEKPNIMNLQKDNKPHIIVQSHYGPKQFIKPNHLNQPIQPFIQPIQHQPFIQPIQHQPIIQPIQHQPFIQPKNNIRSTSLLDMSNSANDFYNLS
jgi:hypothetical protein